MEVKVELGAAPSSLIQRITRQMTVFSHWDPESGLMTVTQAYNPSTRVDNVPPCRSEDTAVASLRFHFKAGGEQVARYSALATACRKADPDGLSFAFKVEVMRTSSSCCYWRRDPQPARPIGQASRKHVRGLLLTDTMHV
ncbi:hypothetical protein ACSS6W_007009 [Trichoderma asperelloides]